MDSSKFLNHLCWISYDQAPVSDFIIGNPDGARDEDYCMPSRVTRVPSGVCNSRVTVSNFKDHVKTQI